MSFDSANLALQSVCPGNELLYDDKGLPSVMVFIPKFKLSEVITGGADEYHPAFIIDGTVVDGIYISKYQNVVENGRAYSLPGRDPAVNMTWDTARTYCEAKGAGWHLMTKAEWAAIALWCKKNGFMPNGNNNYGKDSTETLQKAIPATYDSEGKILHTLTGTGPMSWRHNNAPDGICDLNGNVSEWTGALRTVYGEIQVLADNNGANSDHSQGASSDQWKAIDATTGAFITPNGSGTTPNSVKVDNVSGVTYGITVTTTSESFNAIISAINCTDAISDAAKATLRAYGLLPEAGGTASDYGNDRLYFNNVAAERLFYSGGGYNGGTNAGVFCSGGYFNSRSYTAAGIGFRAAYASLTT